MAISKILPMKASLLTKPSFIPPSNSSFLQLNLSCGVNTIRHGASTTNNGVNTLNIGANTLKHGGNTLKFGVDTISHGVSTTKNGVNTIEHIPTNIRGY